VALMFSTLGRVAQLRRLPQQEQREVISWALAALGALPLRELDHTAVGSVLAGLGKAGVNATNALHATGSHAAAADLGAALDRLLLLRTPRLARPPPPQYYGMAALALKRLAHRPPGPWLKMFFSESGPLLGQVGWGAAGRAAAAAAAAPLCSASPPLAARALSPAGAPAHHPAFTWAAACLPARAGGAHRAGQRGGGPGRPSGTAAC
jgi:hypothetical protein